METKNNTQVYKLGLLFSCILLIALWLPAFAYGSDTTGAFQNGTEGMELGLTLDSAVNQALAHSTDLVLSDYDIERNEEMRQAAADKVKYTPTDGSSSGEATSAFLGLVQSDLTLQMSKKTKTIKKDILVKSVYEKYTNVLIAKEKVTVAEKALAQADFQRLAARISFQLQKVSLNSKIEAEANYLTKEAALGESRANLEDSYLKLNNLIGLNPQDRPVLTDEPAFVPLIIDNLEAEVQRRLEIDPSLWLSDKDVEKAKLDLTLYNWGSSQPYRTKVIDLDKAEINAGNDKDNASQAIYNTYKSICQSEEQYKIKQQDLQLSEQSLQVNQLKYRLGMVAKGVVLTAESQVASTRLALKSAAYQHEILKMSFDKPWTA